MSELERYQSDAKYLASKLVTHWEAYDFDEMSDDPEKRVPRITFEGVTVVSVTPKLAEHVRGFAYEKFIRRYEVEYQDGKFVFVLTVEVPYGHVREYKLAVYLVEEREIKQLFSERLEKIK